MYKTYFGGFFRHMDGTKLVILYLSVTKILNRSPPTVLRQIIAIEVLCDLKRSMPEAEAVVSVSRINSNGHQRAVINYITSGTEKKPR